jgi:hypothetical protein
MKATRLGPMLAECTAGEAQPACRDGSKDSRGDLLVQVQTSNSHLLMMPSD